MNPAMNITPMYAGVCAELNENSLDLGPNLPTAPLNTLLGFDLETYQVPLDQLLPSKKVAEGIMSTRKYKQIVSSIKENRPLDRWQCPIPHPEGNSPVSSRRAVASDSACRARCRAGRCGCG